MRPRGKNRKCAKAWKKWEAGYLKKEGGKEEAARERREFYCDNGKIKLRPSDDADVPFTDEQIKAGAKMKGSVYASSKERYKGKRPAKKSK